MTYPKQLSPTQVETLTPIVSELTKLVEGKFFTLKDTPESLDQVRYLIYSYLHENSLKPYYLLKRLGPNELRVIKKLNPSPTIIHGAMLKSETFMIEYLLILDSSDEVDSRLRDAIKDLELTSPEAIEAKDYWIKAQEVSGID